jgi:hypothetical protein
VTTTATTATKTATEAPFCVPEECAVPNTVRVPQYRYIVERQPVVYETIRTVCEYVDIPVNVSVEECNLPVKTERRCC